MKNSLVGIMFITALAVSTTSSFAVRTPVRLYEIAICRFVAGQDGTIKLERGLLDSLGRFQFKTATPVLPPDSVPPGAIGIRVISKDDWLAYVNLSPVAVDNFSVNKNHPGFPFGGKVYYPVTVAEYPVLSVGDAVNLSTRGDITTGSGPLIGGFTIEGQHRWVLIRVVGPSLSSLGVENALEDPFLVVYKNNSQVFLLFNDDWGQRYDADLIEHHANDVGAFPLPRGSKDAAYLAEFPPGSYTVHATSANGGTGTVLLEIYMIPY